MYIPDEGHSDAPVFLCRRIGEGRYSAILEDLYQKIGDFLENESDMSEKELQSMFELLHRGGLEIQKKRRMVLMKKVEILRKCEAKQKKIGDRLRRS